MPDDRAWRILDFIPRSAGAKRRVSGRIPSPGPTLDQNPDLIPTDPPATAAALFSVERERLLHLLNGLGQADWVRSTPCPGRRVADLATHLLADDLGLLARQRDGHHGTAPPAGATATVFTEWLDRVQDEWVRAARQIGPHPRALLRRPLGFRCRRLPIRRVG